MAEEIAIALFGLFGTIKIIGYLLQIARIATDPGPAAGVSMMAWTIFGMSHASTVAYALLAMHDWRMAALFAANVLCCVTIVVLLWLKRSGRIGPYLAVPRGIGTSPSGR